MTAATVVTLIRKFKLGATVLDDPAPHLSPEEALKLFIPNYPFLASARLGEPVQRGEIFEYPVEKPQVQTKGAAKPRAKPTQKRDSRRATTSTRARSSKRRPGITRTPSSVESAIEALEEWGRKPAASPTTVEARWAGVSELTIAVLDREASPIRDAFSIPLA